MNNYGNNNIYYQNPFSNMKGFFRSKNMLVKLIIINVAVWIIVRILDVILDLFNQNSSQEIIQWLAVPANLNALVLKPWTLFTYMFLHYDLWHILFNMLWLYWFGRIFLEYLSDRQLLSTYLIGGLAGAAMYIISYNIFPKFQEDYLRSVALGASASVMAIVVSISYYVPNYRIYLLFIGPIRIIYIALVSIGLDVLMIRSENSGGHLAHLGGAIYGFLYIYAMRRGIDFSNILNSFSRIKLKNPVKKKKKTHFRNVYTNARPMTDEDYNFEKKKQQEHIDKILDKISKSGYESLTKEEKELLFKTSNRKE